MRCLDPRSDETLMVGFFLVQEAEVGTTTKDYQSGLGFCVVDVDQELSFGSTDDSLCRDVAFHPFSELTPHRQSKGTWISPLSPPEGPGCTP